MAKTVLICGKLFDGAGDELRGRTEVLIEDDAIAEVSEAVGRPNGARASSTSATGPLPQGSSTPMSTYA